MLGEGDEEGEKKAKPDSLYPISTLFTCIYPQPFKTTLPLSHLTSALRYPWTTDVLFVPHRYNALPALLKDRCSPVHGEEQVSTFDKQHPAQPETDRYIQTI